ncbi:MAG: cysteine--tRNA ligase, partial [Cryobacterium sp.]|nr:cysteine--tRNA ligase [Cryobacterium sp.]
AARDYPDLSLNDAIARVTALTEEQFHRDIAALGVLPPTEEPRATAHIPEMRDLIERLIAREVAYVAEDHVLFAVSAMERLPKAPRYGALARRSLDEMLAGARVDVAPYKRDPMDFVLWKPSKPGEPGWESPGGIAVPGRPGWHIECSAMSMAKLLTPFGGGLTCDDPAKNIFDIHGGGIDLVFPHHENEIAQSCCAFDSGRMANVWMHNGFLMVEGEKMSKSLGNFITIRQLLSDWKGYAWPGEALRFNMLRTHYRQPIDWTFQSLDDSHKTLWSWYELVQEVAPAAKVPSEILDAISDDLNTSLVITELHGLFRSRRLSELRSSLYLLGFSGKKENLHRIARAQVNLTTSGHLASQTAIVGGFANTGPSEIDKLVEQRNAARARKDWKESDRIRDELKAMGVVIKDNKDGTTTWEVAR